MYGGINTTAIASHPSPARPRVYNPFTLIHGLDRTLKEADLRSLAAEGHWPSAWSESGHPGLAARLAADTRQPLPGTRVGGRIAPAATPWSWRSHPPRLLAA